LALVLLPACTRLNLAYGDGDGDGTEADEDGTNATSEADATRGEADTTRGDLDTTHGESEGSLDTGASCEPFLAPPFELYSTPEPWLQLPRQECAAGSVVRPYRIRVQEQLDEFNVDAQLCSGTCECGGPPSLLEFGAPLPPLSTTGCYDLVVEFVPSREETCQVQAYMLTDGTGPVTVVSNVIGPGFPQPFALQLADEPVEVCALGCTPEAGVYALVTSLGEVEIPPDQANVDYEGYKLANFGSGIDAECSAVGRWIAVRQ
jgi:hypothetical protein